MIIVVMGVSGCGKTAVGRELARRLGRAFLDADDFHPPANVAKMSGQVPLDDADRRPWLDAINARLRDGDDAVLACSALKQTYRETLGRDVANIRWVYLKTDFATAQQRMRHREHFMPPELLRSQFDTLEEPTEISGVITVDAQQSLSTTIDQLTRSLPPGGDS